MEDIKEYIQQVLQQQKQEFEIELSKRDQRILELENKIKVMELKMRKELEEVKEQTELIELYSHEKMPKLKYEQEYMERICNESEFDGNICNPYQTSWKLLYYHFFVDKTVAQQFAPNKYAVLVSTKRWNVEKKPEIRWRGQDVHYMLTNNHYFEFKLQDEIDINKVISLGVVPILCYET